MTSPCELDLVEPAAALAAVRAQPDRFAGRQVAVVCSGGNIGPPS